MAFSVWTSVSLVATFEGINNKDLCAFALNNVNRFGVLTEFGTPEITNMMVPHLVHAYMSTKQMRTPDASHV